MRRMIMDNTSHLWSMKNETLSDKTTEKEYGISREEIYAAINAGELQFKQGSVFGNPWYRLLRVEVERLVEKKYGADYLREKKAKKELSEINRELKSLKTRVNELENRKKELLGN
jgi:hypothetical protein